MCCIVYAGVSRSAQKKTKPNWVQGDSKQVSEARVPPPKLAPRLTGVNVAAANQAASGPLSWNTVSTTKGSGAAFTKVLFTLFT